MYIKIAPKVKNVYDILKSDFIILILILFLGVFYIAIESGINPANTLNIDEKIWIPRSYKYLEAIKNFDFKAGITTVHPGITVMLLGGISLALSDHFLGAGAFYHSSFANLYIFALDIPIIAAELSFFFSFYFVLRKMKFNKILSFLVLILISVNSFYALETTPVDKFAAISILLSLSFLLVYVNGKFFDRKYLFLSSFFAAFGILSKLSALILIPFSLFILLYFSSLNSHKRKGAIRDFLLYLFYLLVFSVLIFPGFLLDPLGSIRKITGSFNNSLVSGWGKPLEVHSFFEKLQFHLGFFANGGFDPLATGFFLFFLIFLLRNFARKGILGEFCEENLFYKNLVVLLAFGLVYFLYAAYFSSLLFYRYMLPAFIIFDIGAAIGFYCIILWCKDKFFPKKSVEAVALRLVIAFYVFQFAQLLLIYNFAVPVKY